jgi:hypothetical protein
MTNTPPPQADDGKSVREIKFRAWLKEEKLLGPVTSLQWLDLMDDTGRLSFETVKVKVGLTTYTAFPHEVELMQYTGLHDKNGVEIYAGDIVKHRTHWSDNRSQSEVKYWSDTAEFYPFGSSDWAVDADEVEVIGNIWKNPALLKPQASQEGDL